MNAFNGTMTDKECFDHELSIGVDLDNQTYTELFRSTAKERLNGDIEFALFVYFRKCQGKQKEQTQKISKLNQYEKRKLKRLGKKNQLPK